MLKIRKEQMDFLNHQRLEKFVEDELLPYVIQYFPIDYALLGESACLRALIIIAHRGTSFDYTTKAQLCSWTVLSLMLGTYLDKDPLLPWYGKFQSRSFENPELHLSRIDRLADAYIKQTIGENGEHFLKALLKIYHMELETFSTPDHSVRNKSLDLFETINSRKYDYVRGMHWDDFFNQAEQVFQQYEIKDPSAQTLLCCLLFLLGTRVSDDSIHLWVQNTLKDLHKYESHQHSHFIFQQSRAFASKALSLLKQHLKQV